MVAVYDISDLDEGEVDGLAGEVHAQAEESDLHGDVDIAVVFAEGACADDVSLLLDRLEAAA